MEKKLKIWESLVEIQRKIKVPKKNINNFGGYSYRSAEDILEAIRPLLNEINCSITLIDEPLFVEGKFELGLSVATK